jgi:hypothetical protein
MDKDALFAARLPQEEFEIPGVGTVTIRGLSRAELLLSGKHSDAGALVMERHMLHYAMVDPAVSVADVEKWQRAAPAGELQPLVNKVNELSGIGRDVQKEAIKSLREGPESGV